MNKTKNSNYKKIRHLSGPTKLTQKLFFWCFGFFALVLTIVLIIGSLQKKTFTNEIILSGLSGKNQIALTFNVGKDLSPEQIVSLSNLLLTAKIPCTFFVPLGGAKELSPVWKAQIMNGNEMDYFYDEDNFDSISNFEISNSFNSWETYVQANIDSNLTAIYIRAGNSYDYKNFYVQTALAEKSANLIGWSVELKDMSKMKTTDLEKILNAEILDGAIIKMDISDYNLETLISLLAAEAKTKKLNFVVLGKMFEP